MSFLQHFLQNIAQLQPHQDNPQKSPFFEVFYAWAHFFIQELPTNTLFDQKAWEKIQLQLYEKISSVCSPTFLLEMHIAKMEGELEGQTTEERYHSFVTKWCFDPKKIHILFDEYPLLAEKLDMVLQNFFSATKLWIEHLQQDQELLEKTFSKENPLGKVQDLHLSLGDSHEGGKGVIEILFENGTSIFYKPKSQMLGEKFHQFLQALNQMGLPSQLSSFHLVDRGDYGWIEKVHHQPCNTKQEVQEYFYKIGEFAALLYLLRGTDYHAENLIASGKDPVLIDLETFFSPKRALLKKKEVSQFDWDSILESGLFTAYVLKEDASEMYNISGIYPYIDEYPVRVLVYEHPCTDNMRLVYRERNSKRNTKNKVILKGKIQDPAHYIQEIVQGFEDCYRCILNHRKEIDTLLDIFQDIHVRYIALSTNLYTKLITKLTDPTVLQKKEQREEIFKRYFAVQEESGQKNFKQIVAAEKQAIIAHDVPYFTVSTTEKHVYAYGNILAENTLIEAPLNLSKERLYNFSEEDLHKQSSYIRYALYSFNKEQQKRKPHELPEDRKPHTQEEMHAEAEHLGEAILKKAMVSKDGGLNWLTLNLFDTQFRFEPINDSLYNGKVGIALFFAALFHSTKKEKWLHAAHDTLGAIFSNLGPVRKKLLVGAIGVGGFVGIAGICYSLDLIGNLLQEKKWKEEAYALAKRVTQEHIDKDHAYDLLIGSAGLIPVFIKFYQDTLDPFYLEMAKYAGKHLLKHSHIVEEDKIAWKASSQDRYLLGFSHGVSGIAYALIQLAKTAGEKRFLEASKKALATERFHFSEKHQNWPDFRQETAGYVCGWCHGATGIGFGRLGMLKYYQDDQIEKEIEIALQTTTKHLDIPLHQLCCGGMSKIEFLRSYVDKKEDPTYRYMALSTMSAYMQYAKDHGNYVYFGKCPDDVFNPGFMQGAAGIGYTLLRLCDEKKNLPNVLLLE